MAIVPLDDDSNVILVKQYRYPIGSLLLEVPAGIIEDGESPIECAQRELQEEIGYKAGKMEFIANIHPAIGFANEIMSIYLAEGLEKTNYNRDKDEFIELIPTNMEEALNLVWENKITDVKSIIGLLWLKRTKSNN